MTTRTKFYYRHIPTGKWCYLYFDLADPSEISHYVSRCALVDDLPTDRLFSAKNVLQEDLTGSKFDDFDDKRYALEHIDEFELVEIEVNYEIKTINS